MRELSETRIKSNLARISFQQRSLKFQPTSRTVLHSMQQIYEPHCIQLLSKEKNFRVMNLSLLFKKSRFPYVFSLNILGILDQFYLSHKFTHEKGITDTSNRVGKTSSIQAVFTRNKYVRVYSLQSCCWVDVYIIVVGWMCTVYITVVGWVCTVYITVVGWVCT